MGVGVDGEDAAQLRRPGQQPVRRILAFRAAVDLDRDAVIPAGGEDRFRRRRPTPAGPAATISRPVQWPSTFTCGLPTAATIRSVIGSAGMRRLRVHAGDHHVQPAQQVVALVQCPVVQDVDLDPGQDAERGQLLVQLADQLELGASRSADRPLATVSRGE